ncbi:MAG: uroporphyrinogen-III synthase [Actinomycetales bacterium]|nr:uroporphyrinogen-III synthase [Actinomycetales bacterium]
MTPGPGATTPAPRQAGRHAGDTGHPGRLTGFRIVLTCDRRSAELAAGFTRRGADVLVAPALRIVPLVEDAALVRATEELIATPPDDLVVTTGIGFRGWVEVADAAGLAPRLLEVLADTRILARGPKARGAVRAAGLREEWSAVSETTAEVVDRLVDHGVTGRRVAVQLHGLADDHLLARLAAAGASVTTVRVYRWGPSPDPSAVARALDAVRSRTADAVVFTSAPGSHEFLESAGRAGCRAEVLDALRGDVVPAAVGPVTAAPLVAAGLDPLVPDRFRLGALVRVLADHLAGTRVRRLVTPGGVLELRGRATFLDGEPVSLSPAPTALLRVLAERPGEVVTRHRLLDSLPEAADLHAVEVAVARLRAALGHRGIVETVVKRGYRLSLVGTA